MRLLCGVSEFRIGSRWYDAYCANTFLSDLGFYSLIFCAYLYTVSLSKSTKRRYSWINIAAYLMQVESRVSIRLLMMFVKVYSSDCSFQHSVPASCGSLHYFPKNGSTYPTANVLLSVQWNQGESQWCKGNCLYCKLKRLQTLSFLSRLLSEARECGLR